MQPKIHQLKTDPMPFQSSWDKVKPYEIRFNDRNFQPGDILILMETKYDGESMNWEDDKNFFPRPLIFTHRTIIQVVESILYGPIYGLADKWVILSVREIYRSED